MVARLLLWLVDRLRRVVAAAAAPQDAARARRARTAAGAAPEAMVDCAPCGLHFPASEALRDGARAPTAAPRIATRARAVASERAASRAGAAHVG